jgi:hypothetical protein
MKSIKKHPSLLLPLMETVPVELLLSQEQQPVPAQSAEKRSSPQQLEHLVAPIALYPDSLLSQLLVTCTYPLEVVEAGQWLQQASTPTFTLSISARPMENSDRSVRLLQLKMRSNWSPEHVWALCLLSPLP